MALFRKKPQRASVDAAVLAEEVAVVRSVLAWTTGRTDVHFGAPTRCPQCGNFGFVNAVHGHEGVCFNTCLSCSHEWAITRRAIRAERAERRAASAAAPVGAVGEGGVLLGADPQPAAEAFPVVEPPADPAIEAAAEPTEPDRALEPAAPPSAVPVAAADRAPEEVAVTPVSPDEDAAAPLRVLVVEDNVFDMMLLEALVAALPAGQVDLVHAATLSEGARKVARGFDLVLLDLGLPGTEGIATILEWQHQITESPPVVIVSGSSQPELIDQARALGVATFVQKSHVVALCDDAERGAAQLLRLLSAQAVPRVATSTVL